MQKIFMALFVISSSAVCGEWDYNAGFGYRSEPLGVAANATAGFGQTLWDIRGQSNAPSGFEKIMFGYVRPQLRVQTSGVVNSFDSRLEIFPISIFGLSLGHNSSFRQIDFEGVPCETVTCRGQINRSYLQMQMVGGVSQFVLVGLLRFESLEGEAKGRAQFYDEASSLLASQSGDTLSNIDAALLFKPTDSINFGVLHSRYRFQGSNQKADLNSLIYSHKAGVYQYQAGLGVYNSSITPKNSPTFFVSMKWIPKASVGIL